MARPKSKGAYAPLAAQYYLDDAILEAGPEAELLFIRCLSFLASIPTDGFITERQMKVVGIGLRNMPRRIETLLGVGLLEASSGGFVARSWLKWNKSAEEIGKLLQNDRERKARKAEGEPANSSRIPVGFQSDSSDQSSTEQSSTEQSSTSSSEPNGSDLEIFSDDVIRLCELLGSLIRLNGNNVRTIGKTWWRSCERLIRIDGYTPDQIEWVMRWAQGDEFWQGNILSMPKFREKFDQLKTKAMAESNNRKVAKSTGFDIGVDLVQQEREREANA